MKTGVNRRPFLRGAAALGVAARADIAGAAQEASPGRGSFPLPARGEFVIRGAYVMTMDPTLGDIPRGDVHVKNGAIVAVGAGLKAGADGDDRSEEHTSELQSQSNLVCRLLLEKKKR